MSATTGRVLVLAGHDPTGGAGVDADARAIEAAGAAAVCVVTNRTRQDGRSVFAVEPVALDEWTARAARAFDAGDVRAVKTGLLSSAAQVDAAADLVRTWRTRVPELVVVVDPVLAASGGEVFLDAAGRARLVERLGDLAALLTPNVLELAALVGADADALAAEPAHRVAAARELVSRGARAVAAKGGHGNEDPVVDLLVRADGPSDGRSDGRGGVAVERFERPRLAGRAIHGSGCRFASFAAGRCAAGADPAAAVEGAGAYVHGLLAAAGESS